MASPLPTDARDRKRIPLVTGCLDYFPAALAEVARVSLAGNEQHHPGEPLRHERGKSADHADALGRHLVDRGTLDTDGHRHSAKVAWRALALLQEELEAAGAPLARGARLPEATPTPTSETAAAMREALAGGLKAHATVMADLASVPCAECGTRDGNGECSAQCVREEPEPSPATLPPASEPDHGDCHRCVHYRATGPATLPVISGTISPCLTCYEPSRPNWEPELPTRECATCRHNLASAGSYGGPCLDCHDRSHWEPRECATCRHNLRWTSEPPCCDCRNWSRWEPKP